MNRQIAKNAVRCKICDVVIESKHRHDFVWCPGKHVAVDGGKDYLKRCGNVADTEELSEFEPCAANQPLAARNTID